MSDKLEILVIICVIFFVGFLVCFLWWFFFFGLFMISFLGLFLGFTLFTIILLQVDDKRERNRLDILISAYRANLNAMKQQSCVARR
jgi:hypothetical protein